MIILAETKFLANLLPHQDSYLACSIICENTKEFWLCSKLILCRTTARRKRTHLMKIVLGKRQGRGSTTESTNPVRRAESLVG